MRKTFILLAALCAASPGAARELELGIGWPYAGVKMNLEKVAAEARYAAGDGIRVYQGRAYWNYLDDGKLKAFAGPEFGYVKFDTLSMKGTGYESSVFIGCQYYATRRISIGVDFGPTLIGLNSGDYSVSGIEWVFNSTLYFRFWGGSDSDDAFRSDDYDRYRYKPDPPKKRKRKVRPPEDSDEEDYAPPKKRKSRRRSENEDRDPSEVRVDW